MKIAPIAPMSSTAMPTPVAPPLASPSSRPPIAPADMPPLPHPEGFAAAPEQVRDVWDSYAHAVMRLPGVLSVSWLAKEPTVIRLHVANDELQYLISKVLAPAVNGVTFEPYVTDSHGAPPQGSWVYTPTNVIRTMSMLPGVIDWQRAGGYAMLVDTQERLDWLRPLLAPEIDGAPLRLYPQRTS